MSLPGRSARSALAVIATLVTLTLVLAPSADAGKGGNGKGQGKGKPPKTTTTTSTTTIPEPGSFTDPVVVHDDGFGLQLAEPGIDVAEDGTVYVNAPPGLPEPSFVYRLRPDSDAWVDVSPFVVPGGGDSDVVLDATEEPDTVYFTDLWLGSASVAASDDQGDGWLGQPLGGPLVQDRQWLASPGAGRVYQVTNQIPSGLTVSRSFDGLVYVPVGVAVTTVERGFVGPPGTMVAVARGLTAASDVVGVVYDAFGPDEDNDKVCFARSDDGGATFDSVLVKDGLRRPGLAFQVVAWAGGDRLVMVFQDVAGTGAAERSRVWFARSDDLGATWRDVKVIVGTGTPVFPWVDARGDKVSVSLYHTPDDTDTPDDVAEDAKWYQAYMESTDGGASFTGLQRVHGTPVKSGPICTQGAACDEDRELLDFQSVAIGPDGRAHLAWTRSKDNESDTEILYARQS